MVKDLPRVVEKVRQQTIERSIRLSMLACHLAAMEAAGVPDSLAVRIMRKAAPEWKAGHYRSGSLERAVLVHGYREATMVLVATVAQWALDVPKSVVEWMENADQEKA